jgi:lipoprotein-anchoring transpeptidase ErfK/SrfK
MSRIEIIAVASFLLALASPASAATRDQGADAATNTPAPAVAAVTTPDADEVAPGDPASDNLEKPSGPVPSEATEPVVPAATPPPPPPEPTLIAAIDLSEQKMTVKVNGEFRYSWPISSGTAQHPTPTGTFRPEWTSKMWYSRKYDWAPMPNAVFINGGVAVHGTYAVSRLGSPASHGCIRLAPTNAKTFFNLVQKHGLNKVKVTVFGKPNWRGDAIASRSSSRKRSYADNDYGSYFWGSGQRRRPARGQTYYYADGTPAKVYRKRNGELLVAPRRRMPNTYGFGYGNDW